MTTTFCNSGSVKLKSGKDVNTDLTDDQYTEMINQAEAKICAEIKIPNKDLVGDYAGLSQEWKDILEDACSSDAAITAINYDLGSYFSTARAQTLLNLNYTRWSDAMKLLRDKKNTDYLDTL